ncbi:MAG: hypothetical protein ACREO2_08105, partial [Arenimonas sp.]
MQKAWTLIGTLLLAGLLVCGKAHGQAAATEATPAPAAELDLSLAQSNYSVTLEDMLTARESVNLSPVIGNEISITSRAGGKYWLRMKVSLPAEAGEMLLSFERQNVQSIKLYQIETNDKKVSVIPFQSSQMPHQENTRGSWPTRIVFVLPPAVQNGSVLYAEIEPMGFVHLRPRLLNAEQQAESTAADDDFFIYLYLSMLILICLAIYRQLRAAESQAILIGLGLIVGLFGFFAYNTHLPLFLKTDFINKPSIAYALIILITAPFLAASNFFSGFNARWVGGATWIIRFSIALMGLAIFVATTDFLSVAALQLMTASVWTLCLGIAISIYLFDVRTSRWAAIIVAIGLLAAIWAPSFVFQQALPSTRMNLYGFQIFFIVLMAVYLLLPWLRQVLQERGRKRRVVPPPELTTDEKIAIAREQLMASLQSALV